MIAENFNRIIAVETALPALQVSQLEALELFRKHRSLSPREKVLYERFLSEDSIETRHVASTSIEEIFTETADQAHERFSRYALALATQALEKACTTARLRPKMLDGLVIATCTGYLCPGLSSYVMEQLGLREGLRAYDLVGHGCAAGLPALRCADEMLESPGVNNVAVVCVEICTAAILFGEATELILSNSIFGDGAAACIVSRDPKAPGIVLEGIESLIWPRYRDDLRFIQKDGRLCNKLSKRVPSVVAEAVEHLRRSLDIPGSGMCRYAFHSGGKKILDAIETRLELDADAMKPTREILRRYGNMSSGSVLFVLKELMPQMTNGEKVLMFSYGAGFAAFGALGYMSRPSQLKGGNNSEDTIGAYEQRPVDQGSWI